MSTDEPRAGGVTLRQYAAVIAGVAAGFALDEVLSNEGVDARRWARAEEAWSDRLDDEPPGEEPLADRFDARLAEARARYGRRVRPLDEDLRAWLDFVRRWSAAEQPLERLAELGLRGDDVLRLHQLWSSRLSADPALQRRAQAILAEEPAALPAITTEPARLVPAPDREAPVQHAAAGDEAEEDDDEEEDDDDEDDVDLDRLAPPEQALFTPLPGTETEPEPARASAPRIPRFHPPVAVLEAQVETLPATASPLRGGPDLPFASAPASPAAASKPSPLLGSTVEGAMSPFARPLAGPLPFAPAASTVLPVSPAAASKPSPSLGSTVEGAMSPFAQPLAGPLPFAPAAGTAPPASPPAASKPSPSLGSTVEGAMSPFARPPAAPLPFAPVSKAPPAPAPALPVVNKPRPELSGTTMGSISPLAAPLPFQQAAPGPPAAPPRPPELTMDQYASLCAELAAFPDAVERTFLRYGLVSPAARAALDTEYKERLRRDPAEYAAWQRLYLRYFTYWADQAARGVTR